MPHPEPSSGDTALQAAPKPDADDTKFASRKTDNKAKYEVGGDKKRTFSSASFISGNTEYVEEVVVLSKLARRCIWLVVFLLVIGNIALLTTYAVVYMQNGKRDSFLWLFRVYFLFSKGNAFLHDHSKTVATGYAVLSAVFSAVALRFLWAALLRRQLRRGAATQRASRVMNALNFERTLSLVSASVKRTSSAFGSSLVVKKVGGLHTRWEALFGVRGPYFDLRLIAEETYEVAAQTIAAYSASQSISNVPLNILYAVVIFLNCNASFVLRRVFKSSIIKQRFACLLTDIVIDFVWGSLLPVWMYLPLIKVYLDREHVMDSIANFSNSTREVERVLILSWPYYLLSIAPFINALVSLTEVQNILQDLTPSSKKKIKADGTTIIAQDDGATELALRYPVGRLKHGLWMRIIHAFLPLYGVGILLTSLAANGVFRAVEEHTEYSCIHRVHPWFSTKEACLGREIQCSSLNLTGSVVELEQALNYFDEKSLADLYLTNCPALVVPSKIQTFPNLMTFVIKDSTLVEWGESAGLTDEAFSDLRTIQLSAVELMQLPIGLIGVKPIAWSVEWVHMEFMNASSLLSQVGDHWRSLLFLDCVGCGLTTLPEPLFSMPRQLMIMLVSNNLSVIPDKWTADLPPQLQSLWMDDNPLLTELPDAIWKQSKTLGFFTFTGTNLSAVPDWVADVAGPEFMISAAGTPICTGAAPVSKRVQKLIAC